MVVATMSVAIATTSKYVYIPSLNRITSTRDVTFPNNEMQFTRLPESWTAHMYFPEDTQQAVGDEYQQRVPLPRPPQPLPTAARRTRSARR